MAHDWAADSPRLAGVNLFDEVPSSAGRGRKAIRLAKLGNACVFLEPDNLCPHPQTAGAGGQARPLSTVSLPHRKHPRRRVRLARLRLHGGARRHGRAADRADGGHRSRLPGRAAPRADAGRAGASRGAACPPTTCTWQAEAAAPLAQLPHAGGSVDGHAPPTGPPLEQRLLALDRLLVEAEARSGGALAEPSEALATWTRDLASQDYAPLFGDDAGGHAAPMRQRAVLAPFVGGLEEQWATWGTKGGGLITRPHPGDHRHQRARRAAAQQPGGDRRPGTDAPHALPAGRPGASLLVTRYLKGLIHRKSLIDGTDLYQGYRYLLLSFAAARWYAVAAAAIAGRPAADLDDLRQGIRVVEKGHRSRGGTARGHDQCVVRFLFGRVGSPATVIHNFYVGE